MYLSDLAFRLCILWHADQKDRRGLPVYEHPIEVAYRVFGETGDVEAYQAALLHDTLEDTAMPHKYLKHFSQRTREAVLAITRGDTESANSYIRRVLALELASMVKVHDIEHNFSPGRADDQMLDKAEMYAGWHFMLCDRLGIDRSFCDVNPAVVWACECHRHTDRARVRRRARSRRISANAREGTPVSAL